MARVLNSPAPGRALTSPFGPRPDSSGQTDGFHNGIDFAGDNFPVVAAADGEVVAVGGQYSPFSASGFGYIGAGNFVLIRHNQYGFRTGYCHLRAGSRTVSIGDLVTAGQVVGRSGETGNAFGAHLHFDLWTGLQGITTQVDPEPYINWNEEFEMSQADIDQMKSDINWIKSRIGGTMTSASLHESATGSKGREDATLAATTWLKERIGGSTTSGAPTITQLLSS